MKPTEVVLVEGSSRPSRESLVLGAVAFGIPVYLDHDHSTGNPGRRVEAGSEEYRELVGKWVQRGDL